MKVDLPPNSISHLLTAGCACINARLVPRDHLADLVLAITTLGVQSGVPTDKITNLIAVALKGECNLDDTQEAFNARCDRIGSTWENP